MTSLFLYIYLTQKFSFSFSLVVCPSPQRYTQAPFLSGKFKSHSLIALSPQTQKPTFYPLCLSSLIYSSKDSPARCFSCNYFLSFEIFLRSTHSKLCKGHSLWELNLERLFFSCYFFLLPVLLLTQKRLNRMFD